ncbi:hypothetical protein QBC35DRAFT_460471 [Podospora australis]|uniref:Uncharacterized protein n=1 Tax=Podospora australis TaxID=1536484 RepID=A0AAN6WZH3_9PEZI|nr:hypothetical protein QBC35DRAFT_460471 [Podospora australis]
MRITCTSIQATRQTLNQPTMHGKTGQSQGGDRLTTSPMSQYQYDSPSLYSNLSYYHGKDDHPHGITDNSAPSDNLTRPKVEYHESEVGGYANREQSGNSGYHGASTDAATTLGCHDGQEIYADVRHAYGATHGPATDVPLDDLTATLPAVQLDIGSYNDSSETQDQLPQTTRQTNLVDHDWQGEAQPDIGAYGDRSEGQDGLPQTLRQTNSDEER